MEGRGPITRYGPHGSHGHRTTVKLRQKRIRQALSIGLSVLVRGCRVSVGLSRLKPAAPTVEAATLWPDTVKRGPMVRQVRGLGTLVPEDIRWIPATTQGRVERIVLRPGTPVKADSVILELSNPQLETGAAGRRAEAAGRRGVRSPTSACRCRTTCCSSGRPPPASRPTTTRRGCRPR